MAHKVEANDVDDDDRKRNEWNGMNGQTVLGLLGASEKGWKLLMASFRAMNDL